MSGDKIMSAGSPADYLENAARIYRERNALYGDNYKNMGKILMGFFPNGVVLDTEEKQNRYHLFLHMVGKLSRYAAQFDNGGHPDSLDDNSVYSMMARECDAMFKAKRNKENDHE